MHPPIMIHAPSLLAEKPGSFDIPAGATLEWTRPSIWRAEWSLTNAGRPVATMRRPSWPAVTEAPWSS